MAIQGFIVEGIDMKLAIALAGSLFATLATVPAGAQSLNFAGLDGDNGEFVLDYYNGGFGSAGSGPGPNYGISFSENALACSVGPAGSCDAGPLPTGGNILFFLSGSTSTMNVAGGFNTGFSFYYSAITQPAFVNIYGGLDGTGALLATIDLPLTPSTPGNPACEGANYCPFVPVGVTFAGTAFSVDFGGAANRVAFAAITINSTTPGGVPEPAAWGMMIGGFGMAGAAMRTRRTRIAFTA
jgi:hypothetical protein